MTSFDLIIPLPVIGSDAANRAEKLGFRFGEKGTHTSRTMMFTELEHLLNGLPANASREDYVSSIVEDNITGKRTAATRRLTNQRLHELYGLDPTLLVFRLLRRFWEIESRARPLIALLTALARDPILRASALGVLPLPIGAEFSRQQMTAVIREAMGDRLNTSTLDKVVRNTASTWTQSGHLEGRVRKIRRYAPATPSTTTYALLLGYLLGLRGQHLFLTLWTSILDLREDRLIEYAIEAKRHGLLNMKHGGGVTEIDFSSILNDDPRIEKYVQN